MQVVCNLRFTIEIKSSTKNNLKLNTLHSSSKRGPPRLAWWALPCWSQVNIIFIITTNSAMAKIIYLSQAGPSTGGPSGNSQASETTTTPPPPPPLAHIRPARFARAKELPGSQSSASLYCCLASKWRPFTCKMAP